MTPSTPAMTVTPEAPRAHPGAAPAERVLFVSHTATVSGAEASLLTLLRGLPGSVHALLACPAGELARMAEDQGTSVVPIPGAEVSFRIHPTHTTRELTKAAMSVPALDRLLGRFGPDLVHANSPRAAMMCLAGCGRRGVPLVVHVHDVLPETRLARLLRATICRRAAAVIGNSEFTARAFATPGCTARLRWVPGPVDLERFDPGIATRTQARRALGLDPDVPALAVVAQLTPWKGQDDALRLLAELRRQFPDLVLLLVGEPRFRGAGARYDSRGFARRLEVIASSLGVAGAVRFLGQRSDIPMIMRAIDALLVPSWLEPFGLCIVEAMAMGTPVVASAIAGPTEIIRDGVDGLLCPPRQPDRWVDPVARLLRTASLRRRLGAAAQERARAFSAERHVAAVLDIHGEVNRRDRAERDPHQGIAAAPVLARSRPARVLVLTPDYPPARGGIQLLVQRVASNWRSLRPIVVTLDGSGRGQGSPDGFPVRRLRRSRLGHHVDILRLNVAGFATAMRYRPDAVLAAHIIVAPAAAAIARRLRVPLVLYLYAQEVAMRPRLTGQAIRRASAVVAVSRFTAELASAIRPHPGVSVILPGVDVPRHPTRRDRDGSRAEPTLITVARLVDRYKGHDTVLRALPLVLREVEAARWVVVGDGPLRGTYEEMAERLGVAGHVTFTGEVSDHDRDRLLDGADVFVMASRLSPRGEGEGFGIVYLEAAAHGLPVVAGRVAGATEAIVDGETGLLVDPTDHRDVARALIRLLTDTDEARRMGRSGRLHAEQHSWPAVSAEVEQLIVGLLPGTAGR